MRAQIRKQLVLPGVGPGVREELPGEKVASDGLLKYIWFLMAGEGVHQ